MDETQPAGTGAGGKWPATVTAMLGTFSVVLAATILTVALPQLMRVFAVDQPAVQWLVTGFLAAMTTTMLLTAWCVERFGLRATYVGAMAVFIAGSVLGAAAPGLGWLILARVLEGAAAGVIQPIGMIVVFRVFAPAERGRGFGYYGLGVILAPAVAPVAGGLLVELYSWRATFLLALPACVAALVMALRHLPGRDEGAAVRRLDTVGLVLLAATLAALLWALSRGVQAGWQEGVVRATLAAGVLGLVAFAGWERVCRAPLLDLRVFRSPAFAGGFLLTLAMGAALYASTYLIPLYLQQVRGLSPGATGLVLLPAGLAMAATFPVAGRLTDRVPRALPILAGALLFAVSCVLLGLTGGTAAVGWLVLWVLVGRIGIGLMMPPVTAGSLLLLDAPQVPQASGAINFARQLGGSLGVGAISVVLAQGYPVAFLTLGGMMAAALAALVLMRRGSDR